MKTEPVTLGEIAEVRAGVGFPTRLQGRKSGRYPFAKVGDISRAARRGAHLSSAENYVDDDLLPELGARPFPPHSIVFAKIGEAIRQNFRVLTTCEALLDNNAMGIVCDTRRVLPDFLLHYLRTVDFYPFAGKTTVPALRKSALEALPITLPPLQVQKRIAAILDKADAIRRKRQEAIALTEQLLRSTFLEMFGDPVTNPKRWPEIPLGETLVLPPQIGTTKPAHDDGEYPVVRVGELGRRDIQLGKCGRITLSEPDLERFQCRAGDLLLARAIGSEDQLGKASLVEASTRPIVFDSHLDRPGVGAAQSLDPRRQLAASKRSVYRVVTASASRSYQAPWRFDVERRRVRGRARSACLEAGCAEARQIHPAALGFLLF